MHGMKELADSIVEAVRAYVADESQKALAEHPIPDADAITTQVLEKVTSALDQIPAPKDGKDADPEFIRSLVSTEVHLAVAEIPKPRDGVDGKEVSSDEALEIIQSLVSAAMAALPLPRDGTNGKDASAEQIASAVADALPKAIAEIPVPRDGRDGKDGTDGKNVDPETVAALVDDKLSKVMAALPVPKDGKDADTDVVRAEVQRAFDAFPKPSDGKDADPELVRAEVERAMAAIPKPVDGRDGRDGKGEPGRDAMQIDVLPAIDESRSYPRATYANYRGGVIRSIRTTEPITGSLEAAGWVVHTEGEADFEIEQLSERKFAFKRTLTSGRVYQKTISIPAQIYRKVYVEGKSYEHGDTVTWNGSTWHCNEDTLSKPSEVEGGPWTLANKRGRDGKDGTPGARGDRGQDGKPAHGLR